MKDFITKHLADLGAGKWNDYKATLAADAVYIDPSNPRVKGADAYMQAIQRWKKAFPDLQAKSPKIYIAGDTAIVETRWEGTHDGPLEGPMGTIPATHKFGGVPAVLVFRVEKEKIVECRHYFDVLSMLAQLGVAPAMAATAPAQRAPVAPPRH